MMQGTAIPQGEEPMLSRLFQLLSGGRSRQQGSASVELAITLIPFLLIIGGIVDFGDAYYIKQIITNASREGARYGADYHTDPSGNPIIPENLKPSIASWVQSNYSGLLSASANLSVTPGGTGYTSGVSGDQLTVTVSAQKNWIFLGGLLGFTNPQTLTATTTVTLE
jgi:Flp pilus assembly protein TadG